MPRNRIDLTSMRFGRLKVLEFSHSNRSNHTSWKCVCDCGNSKVVMSHNLKSGQVKSCGCLAKEVSSELFRQIGYNNVVHGNSRRTKTTPEYRAWSQMWNRCENPKGPEYPRYGKRGISVCETWNDFSIFLADMGERPSDQHSLDRIDTELGYSQSNCRWATPQEQANNRRSNFMITHNNTTKTLAEWGRDTGLKPRTISARLDRGWSVSRALNEPIRAA
jgi:hypothetical protein